MIDEIKLIEECEKSLKRMVADEDGKHPVSFERIIEFIKEQPKVGEWILTSKELPKDNEMSEYYDSVIVTLDDETVVCGCYRNRDEEWWVDDEDGEKYAINATGHVIAWMPLPEPFREEGAK